MNKVFAKVFLPLLITNIVFYLPEILIDRLEALDERGANVELKIVESGFKSIQLFLYIHQSGALKMLGLNLENGDFVNELTQGDRGKNVLDLLWFDCRLRSYKLVEWALKHSRNAPVVPLPPAPSPHPSCPTLSGGTVA